MHRTDLDSVKMMSGMADEATILFGDLQTSEHSLKEKTANFLVACLGILKMKMERPADWEELQNQRPTSKKKRAVYNVSERDAREVLQLVLAKFETDKMSSPLSKYAKALSYLYEKARDMTSKDVLTEIVDRGGMNGCAQEWRNLHSESPDENPDDNDDEDEEGEETEEGKDEEEGEPLGADEIPLIPVEVEPPRDLVILSRNREKHTMEFQDTEGFKHEVPEKLAPSLMQKVQELIKREIARFLAQEAKAEKAEKAKSDKALQKGKAAKGGLPSQDADASLRIEAN
jgi:hypothetical protein